MYARTLHHFAFVALLLLALTSCASTPATQKTLAVGSSVTLAPGEQVMLPGAVPLRYLGLKSDSRCPQKTQCIWAGDAEASFTYLNFEGRFQAFELHTNAEPKSFRVDDHTLVLETVTHDSAARATVRLTP